MKTVLLIGYGLAAETFMYCLMKSIIETGESVKLLRTSLGSVKEPRHNIRACFYIHNYLDDNLTPQFALRKYKFRVYGYKGVASERHYDLKVFGECDKTNAHKRIQEVETYGDKKDYFCGKEFCKNLVYYGRRYAGELMLSGQLEIEEVQMTKPRILYDVYAADLIIQAEPLYRLVENEDSSCTNWQDNFETYPIGIRVRSISDADKIGVKGEDDVFVVYNLNEEDRYYREIYDIGNYQVITEYSFGYRDNAKRLYNGGIISPGKILRNDYTQEVINGLTREYGNMIFLGRYASWDPDCIMSDVYFTSNRIIKDYLGLKEGSE